MARKRSRAKKNTIALPGFEGVETNTVIPEGEYLVAVSGVEADEGDNGPYLKWATKVSAGEHEGLSPKPYYTSFSPAALWNLRSLLESLGVETPDEPSEIAEDELIGLECMVMIEHDTYQGRKQSVIVDFWPAEDGEEEEPEEEEPEESEEDESEEEEPEEKPKKKRRGKAKSKEPELIAEDDVNDMDQDELEELIEEHDLKCDLSKLKTISKMRRRVIDALEEAELLEE